MSHRNLQILPHFQQGRNSHVFLYTTAGGVTTTRILKAVRSDRPHRVQSLLIEFQLLEELGQLQSQDHQEFLLDGAHPGLQIFSHPHIVKAYGLKRDFFFNQAFHHVLFLEYCSNGSLLSAIERFPNILSPFNFQTKDSAQPQPTILLSRGLFLGVLRKLLKETVSGLAYVHSRGRHHGDLKLANILLDADFSVKLADFGDSSSSTTFHKKTTPHEIQFDKQLPEPHLAPELFQKSNPDGQKADIFSLGVLIFILLFGEYPCRSIRPSSLFAVTRIQKKIACLVSTHDESDVFSVVQLVQQMLDENPDSRPTVFEIENSAFLDNFLVSIPQALTLIH